MQLRERSVQNRQPGITAEEMRRDWWSLPASLTLLLGQLTNASCGFLSAAERRGQTEDETERDMAVAGLLPVVNSLGSSTKKPSDSDKQWERENPSSVLDVNTFSVKMTKNLVPSNQNRLLEVGYWLEVCRLSLKMVYWQWHNVFLFIQVFFTSG